LSGRWHSEVIYGSMARVNRHFSAHGYPERSPQQLRKMIMSEASFPIRRRVLGTFAAAAAATALVVAVWGGRAISAQDKYTVQIPNGLAFSEFRGYEDWQTIAVSQSEDLIEVILGNPVIIDAFRAGVPGNGKPFPDGSKMAKIHWKA